jgi:hypothetical protein
MSAVARLDDGTVYLKVSADEVTSSGGQDPPVGYESGGQFREHTDVTPSSTEHPTRALTGHRRARSTHDATDAQAIGDALLSIQTLH